MTMTRRRTVLADSECVQAVILGGCGGRCSVNYTVDVPAGVPVSGEVSSGSIHLTRVGAVKVKTSNGRITGQDITGTRIQAQTTNGAINLTPATPLDVQASTSNGAITLTLPKADYQVMADTNNGDKTIGVSDDPSGKFRLELKSSNGDITVKNS